MANMIRSAALALLVLLFTWTPALASVLLLYDGEIYDSMQDCAGSAQALAEAGVIKSHHNLASQALTPDTLHQHSVVVACHLRLDEVDKQRLTDWVEQGGGLLASGQTGLDLGQPLGLGGLHQVDFHRRDSELVFVQDHPATTGSWWSGPITSNPPTPLDEMPLVMRHYYFTGYWPAYQPEVAAATVLAEWGDWDDWQSTSELPAMTAHRYGAGRTIYSGALPGAYASWDWPRTWRTWVVTAVGWLSGHSLHVELGYWPSGHQAALAWTGDTETAAMRTAVPALLDLFETLELTRFGTFYLVGRADPAVPGFEGALENPEIAELIASAGSEVGGHGDVHLGFLCRQPEHCDDDDLAEQTARLADMTGIVSPLIEPLSETISGFRAPFLEFGSATLEALDELGFAHDASEADFWAQTTLPYSILPGSDLLQLPPSMLMDWHLLIQYELGLEVAEAHWEDKLDYILARRGLFSWLHHPWIIQDHLDMVDRFLRRAMNRGDIWFARQDDIAAWWRQRQQIRLSAVQTDDRSWRIDVDHEGDAIIEGVSLWLRPPSGQEHYAHAWLDGGQELPLISREHAGSLFQIVVLPPLSPQGQQRVRLTIDLPIFHDRFEK